MWGPKLSAMDSVLCLNGPNLDLLGSRQPDVYGVAAITELEARVVEWGRELGFDVTFRQTNHEGEMVEAIHSAVGAAGVLVNPGAWGHYSFAIRDAIASIHVPVVEVHLSNVRERSRWRRRTVITEAATANIFGRGHESYRAGLKHLANLLRLPPETHRYGTHPDQVIDLRKGERTSGVLIFHGGFWMDSWGRDTTESWAVDLASRGIPTANAEYRRLPSGGGLRGTRTDAVRVMQEVADLLGVEGVVVVGHSAGAHLAVHAMASSGSMPAGFVSVGGVLDLRAAVADGLGEGAVAAFDPEATTSPLDIPPPPVPIRLVHGEADRAVPVSQSQRYADYVEDVGGDVDLTTVAGEGHFRGLEPSSTIWQTVVHQIETL